MLEGLASFVSVSLSPQRIMLQICLRMDQSAISDLGRAPNPGCQFLCAVPNSVIERLDRHKIYSKLTSRHIEFSGNSKQALGVVPRSHCSYQPAGARPAISHRLSTVCGWRSLGHKAVTSGPLPVSRDRHRHAKQSQSRAFDMADVNRNWRFERSLPSDLASADL